MKERPILFSGEMVKAILAGRKTQTRRLIKNGNVLPQGTFNGLRQGGKWCTNPNPDLIWAQFYTNDDAFFIDGEKHIDPVLFKCPYGHPGDRLWVRETWYYEEHMHDLTAGEPDLPGGRYSRRCVYRSDSPSYPVDVGVGEHGWKPSIHMPRWASRIALEIDEIRVERLRDITEEDAKAEGCEKLLMETRSALNNFMNLWNSIYSERGYGWDTNPWVWVIKFHRIEV